MEIKPVAHFRSPFKEKFGIPRQSSIVEEIHGYVELDRDFRREEALRGLEDFDYVWLIWEFNLNPSSASSLMVRPPRLGGNEKIGVFASRSPFRPNSLALSSVKICGVDYQRGIIEVSGADLADGTPIYDIKPYVPYADCHEGARGGFTDSHAIRRLQVDIPPAVVGHFSETQLAALRKTLALDPRPHYQNDPQKVYGMPFEGRDIHFKVEDDRLTVLDD